MATNDWKAELKRRIDDIKEKKKRETRVRRSSDSYMDNRKSDKTPQAETVEPEKTKPVRNEPVHKLAPKKPVRKDNTMKREETFSPDVKKPVRNLKREFKDTLFHLEPGPESDESSAELNEKEESIIEKLARASSAGTKSAIKEKKESSHLPFDENSHLPDPEFNEPIEKSMDDSHFMRGEKAAGQADPDNLDKILDEYQPLDDFASEEIEEEIIEEEPREHLVLDRTQQHTNMLRIAAAVTDTGILIGLEAIVIWISSMILEIGPMELLFNSFWAFGGLFLSLHFLYMVLFTSITGQTPGKSIFDLKVTSAKPGTIGLLKGVSRWILSFVSLLPAALGYLLMFVTKDGRALHDIILGTRITRLDP